jgi:serine/threonine protein kinase
VEPLKPNDPSQLGDWSITGRLGEGEDSVIYLGVRGVAGSEQAAIKLIEDDSFEFESALGKIKNEVEALRQLNNESIVKFLEANYEQGNLWIATEYIHGVTLDTKLKQTKEPLEELHWFRIAENIFYALEAAHAKGIIHKDVKPSNIILGASRAKLIDFGISHVPERTRIANPGDFEGSRLFSAPENYNRKNIEEMDVFSAGVTLAYAAKLKSVWAGDNQDAITESIKNDKPDLTGLTPLQAEFIRPLLEKLPIDRPKSASVHKKALEYIEYLVDKERKSKPIALRVKKSFSRRLRIPWVKWGAPLALVSAMALAFTSPWSNTPPETQPESRITSEPSPFASPLTTNSSTSLPSASASPSEGSSKNIELAQCLNLTDVDYEKALVSCLKVSEQGDGMATYQVGFIYSRYLNDPVNAKLYMEKAVKLGYIDGYVGLASLLVDQKKYDEAIVLLLKAEKAGSKNSSNLLGFTYEKLNRYNLALKYYLISSSNGEVLSYYNAAMIYYLRSDFDNAIKYFTIAANMKDAPAMYQLGEIYRLIKVDTKTSCIWFNRGSKAGDLKSQTSVKNYCQDDFKVSAPEASNLDIQQLNYRPFLGDSLFYFVWAGTSDKLLDYTGIQVRERDRTDVPWFQVPHKLQNEKDGVYILIDQLFLAVISKRANICWDFRAIKEESGKLVTVWNYQPLSGCAN